MAAKVSIIICTFNRAEYLQQTLESLATIDIPEDLPAEILVIDNASTDHTAEVVRTCPLSNMPLRYLHEPRRGQGYAYSTGMAAAQGTIFLFTDDDMRLPQNWIEGICRPILTGKTHAVAGGVAIAPHLLRPWMTPLHRLWLASTESLDPSDPGGMIGANMSFAKEVLTKVPAFDPELGPGGLGFGGETLFSLQVIEAGYTLSSAFDVAVEHHFDPARLSRSSLIKRATEAGASEAYIAYHWLHSDFKFPQLRLVKYALLLRWARLRKRRQYEKEGCPLWELQLLKEIWFHRQYLIERKRPRNYAKQGLVKRSAGVQRKARK